MALWLLGDHFASSALWLCGDKLAPFEKLEIGAMSWILGALLVVCGDSVVEFWGGDNVVVVALWVLLDAGIEVRV